MAANPAVGRGTFGPDHGPACSDKRSPTDAQSNTDIHHHEGQRRDCRRGRTSTLRPSRWVCFPPSAPSMFAYASRTLGVCVPVLIRAASFLVDARSVAQRCTTSLICNRRPCGPSTKSHGRACCLSGSLWTGPRWHGLWPTPRAELSTRTPQRNATIRHATPRHATLRRGALKNGAPCSTLPPNPWLSWAGTTQASDARM